LYAQGRTLRHIGAEPGVPWTAVGHQLRRAGVTMRRQHLVMDFRARGPMSRWLAAHMLAEMALPDSASGHLVVGWAVRPLLT